MRVIVIGVAGHIGTYLVPMLFEAGHEVIAITRSLSVPYEDAPAWHQVKRILIDRGKDPDFIAKLKAMEPDAIVDLVNFSVAETRKIVEGFRGTKLSHFCIVLLVGPTGGRRRCPSTPTTPKKIPWTTTAGTNSPAKRI